MPLSITEALDIRRMSSRVVANPADTIVLPIGSMGYDQSSGKMAFGNGIDQWAQLPDVSDPLSTTLTGNLPHSSGSWSLGNGTGSGTISIGDASTIYRFEGKIRGPLDDKLVISPGADGQKIYFTDPSLGIGNPLTLTLSGSLSSDGSAGHEIRCDSILKTKFLRGTSPTFTLSGSSLISPLYMACGYAGSSTGNSLYAFDFRINSDKMERTGVSGGTGVLSVKHNVGGGSTTGGRISQLTQLTQVGAASGGGDYITGGFWQTLNYNMGGANGDNLGNSYGLYIQTIVGSGATYLGVVNGLGEVDLNVAADANPLDVLGQSIVLSEGHRGGGTRLNAVRLVAAQAGATQTWEHADLLGGPSGVWPFREDATLYGTIVQSSYGSTNKSAFLPPQKAKWLFDGNNVVPSEGSYRGPGFFVGPSGVVYSGNAEIGPVSGGVSVDITSQIVTGVVVERSGFGSGNGLNNYFPGDVVRGPNLGQYNVDSTKVISAVVVSGGTGGASGTQTVTGTTGTGIKFQASVEVVSGAIVSVNSISVSGSYTVNPTNLSSEPVTGAGLSGATLGVGVGIGSLSIIVPDTAPSGAATYPNPISLTQGSGAGATATLTWAANDLLKLNPTGKSVVFTPPTSAPALSGNGELIFEFTNNTTVTVKGRGSDGTTRSGTITLS